MHPNYKVMKKRHMRNYIWKYFQGIQTLVIVCLIFFTAKSGGLSTRTLLNSPDNYGNVCLHLAIKHGHKEVRKQCRGLTFDHELF